MGQTVDSIIEAIDQPTNKNGHDSKEGSAPVINQLKIDNIIGQERAETCNPKMSDHVHVTKSGHAFREQQGPELADYHYVWSVLLLVGMVGIEEGQGLGSYFSMTC